MCVLMCDCVLLCSTRTFSCLRFLCRCSSFWISGFLTFLSVNSRRVGPPPSSCSPGVPEEPIVCVCGCQGDGLCNRTCQVSL